MEEYEAFYGILVGIFIGLPVFAYGNIEGRPPLIATGSFLTLLAPGVLPALRRLRKLNRPRY
jgi:hypothetical protein